MKNASIQQPLSVQPLLFPLSSREVVTFLFSTKRGCLSTSPPPRRPPWPLATVLSTQPLSPFCHPERSRGICSSTDPSWECFSTERTLSKQKKSPLSPRGFSPSQTKPQA